MSSMGSIFQGEEVDFYDFVASLDYFNTKGVVVELFGDSSTFQYLENFNYYISDNVLFLQDEEEDKLVGVALDRIVSVIEGNGILYDHYLIKLKNKSSIFIHRV